MYNKDHVLREMYDFYLDREKNLAEAAEVKLRERDKEVEEFREQLDKIRKQRELKDSELGKFTEAVYDNHLQTTLEAIYISALEQVAPLTRESEEIAKSLVENYIKESGGAREIIRTRSGKTFLLDTIFEAVDEAAQKDIRLFFEAKDDDEKEEKEKKEEADGSDEVDKEDIKLGDADGDGVDDSQDSDFGTGEDNDKNEEASDSKEKSDVKEDKEDEKKEDEEAKEEDSEDKEEESEDKDEKEEDDDDESADVEDLDKEEVEDDEDESEDEPAEDPDLDEPDTKETVAASQEEPPVEEEPEVEDIPNSKEELFDKLEDSEDVSDAVDIIAKRISDAETKFIEKNSEDKKKIENIVNKMQDRFDAVAQDEDTSPEELEAEQQETQIETARMISEVRDDRFHTVYELMVRDNMDYILKNKALNESYKMDGKIDMTRVMDNSRAMYGWLETVNTIQLDKVNERYIQKLVEGKL